jgi:acetoin utilization deacetylase AcuC-like enzyme
VATGLCWHDRFAEHDMGNAALFVPPGGLVESDVHVDNPARIIRTRRLIERAGLDATLTVESARPATVAELECAHEREYIARIEGLCKAGGGDAGGGYTPMNERSYELAALSAGSALRALELVASAVVENAHAMLRRSGHHAGRDSGYGFCVFNNAAVTARAALSNHGFSRVAIVDVDVHHGNGTEAIFLADPSVLTISIQQDRQFPVDTGSVDNCGLGEAAGTNLNVNLPSGTGDEGYLYAFDSIVVRALQHFGPELIIVSCGVDASYYDPMARLAVTATGFWALGSRFRALAHELCNGRLVSIQEGGYSPQYAPFCWLAFIEGMAGLEPHPDPFEPFIHGAGSRALAPWQRDAVDETVRRLKHHWAAG